jgi:hypothetical protein
MPLVMSPMSTDRKIIPRSSSNLEKVELRGLELLSAAAATAPYFSLGLDNARGTVAPVLARTEGDSVVIFSNAFLDGERISNLSCSAEIEEITSFPTLVKILSQHFDYVAYLIV